MCECDPEGTDKQLLNCKNPGEKISKTNKWGQSKNTVVFE